VQVARKVIEQLQSRIRRHVPKDPFLIYYCVPHKRRGTLSKYNADIRHLLDSLVSALAVYGTAFRSRLSLEWARLLLPWFPRHPSSVAPISWVGRLSPHWRLQPLQFTPPRLDLDFPCNYSGRDMVAFGFLGGILVDPGVHPPCRLVLTQ